jgi:cytochrome c biogenesis protein CcmG/thiol:disulfide interchange protein DsbE
MLILRKIAAWGVVAFAALVLVMFAMPSYRQGEASIAGKTAQDFSLEVSGRSAHLSDYKGKVVVLNFWASWCPPCVEEAPSMNRLQQRIAGRGATILGVSIDEDPEAYAKFLKDFGVPFPTGREPTRKLMHDYGTQMIPETYIIDRHGKLARKVIGPQQWDSPDMLAYFDALLEQS